MTGRLRTSSAGLELIKSFEGFRDAPFRLADGRWTIGHGHVRTAREGIAISEEDAHDLLVYDLKPVEDAIHSAVHAPLSQHQFDALASLGFNIGADRLRESDIIRNLNAGDFLNAANGFDLWRRARIMGRVMVVDALVRRRATEKAMFLEHPDGRPSAPTPLVRPERDTERDAQNNVGASDPSMPSIARQVVAASIGKPRPVERAPSPSRSASLYREPPVDIAEAVRRLAERTNEIIAAAGKPVPPQAELEEQIAEAVEETTDLVAPHTPPRTVDEIETARRAVAERIARILERTERAIAQQQAEQQAAAPPAPQGAPHLRPAPRVEQVASAPTLAGRPAPHPHAHHPVQPPQILPDFDKPAEPRIRPAPNGRPFIDDTETFDPGQDPADMFAAAEKKAKIVNGRSKRLGLINGRWVMLWPWLFILVLSVLGFAIGLVDTFGEAARSFGAVRGASTVLAVFGMMLLMSLYFILSRAKEGD